MQARDSMFCENLENLKSQSLGVYMSSLSSKQKFFWQGRGWNSLESYQKLLKLRLARYIMKVQNKAHSDNRTCKPRSHIADKFNAFPYMGPPQAPYRAVP